MTVQTAVLLLALLGLGTALVCPDGGMCEDKNTCCKNTVGGYGCCPLPHAECCSDHLHCCYQGTICDLAHSRCVNKTVSLPWITRVPTTQALLVPQLEERLKAVMCPDKESECPDDTTCCELLDGSWGCCPLVKAVCCEDKLHCCPEGTKCDVAHSRCVSASLQSVPMLQKTPARRRDNATASAVSAVTCPGGRSSCPDQYTCCLLASGDYGCCPYEEAVCCSDHVHCCPSNTICDLESGVCKSGEVQLPLLRKMAAVPKDVECPDKTSVCPDQTTCCQLTSGSYGCCPMPDAVCCSDHIHCCPAGTQCDLVHSACVSPHRDATEIIQINAADNSKVVSVPCNDSVACADGFTCCKSSEGQWACCPLSKAVCCDDHLHCCPHGTVCNLAASTCDDPAGSTVMPWLEKVPAFPLPADNSRCDKSTSCPGKATCCKTASGGWACCPLPQAVCCDDHVHCCPHGTVCNLEAESCDDPWGLSPPLPMAEKVPALTSDDRDEKCDRQTMCPGGTTCCKKDSGLWACCPLPQGAKVGRIFTEQNFLQRAAKPASVDKWIKQNKMDFLGIPSCVGFGLHAESYRFLIFPDMGQCLQSVMDEKDELLSEKAVLQLACRILDVLQYIHSNEYVHGDISAENIYIKPEQKSQVYLVGYCHAFRYCPGGQHVEYREDSRTPHEGTTEFISLDAHKGAAPSRRSDLQSLGYCMLRWHTGRLPWTALTNPDEVAKKKQGYVEDVSGLLRHCLGKNRVPTAFQSFLAAVMALQYSEQPDYSVLKSTLRDALLDLGGSLEQPLSF